MKDLQMHLLCYIAHLRIWARTLTRNEDLLSLCLSLIPMEQMAAAHHRFDIPTAEKFLHWFGLVFQPAKKEYIAKNGFCYAQVLFSYFLLPVKNFSRIFEFVL